MGECTEYHHRIRCLFVFSCYVIINILAFFSNDSKYCIFVLLKRVWRTTSTSSPYLTIGSNICTI